MYQSSRIVEEKQVSLFALRITSVNPLDNSLIWRAVGRVEAGQSQVEGVRWLKVARKCSPDCGIKSKQVVVTPGRSGPCRHRASTSAQNGVGKVISQRSSLPGPLPLEIKVPCFREMDFVATDTS
ncbi:hypothetical protein TNCV_1175431 [Trichonephila clavipes]|nr:hypothetical protein TNCV_1175431 [Trichonephila clavipes]